MKPRKNDCMYNWFSSDDKIYKRLTENSKQNSRTTTENNALYPNTRRGVLVETKWCYDDI